MASLNLQFSFSIFVFVFVFFFLMRSFASLLFHGFLFLFVFHLDCSLQVNVRSFRYMLPQSIVYRIACNIYSIQFWTWKDFYFYFHFQFYLFYRIVQWNLFVQGQGTGVSGFGVWTVTRTAASAAQNVQHRCGIWWCDHIAYVCFISWSIKYMSFVWSKYHLSMWHFPTQNWNCNRKKKQTNERTDKWTNQIFI